MRPLASQVSGQAAYSFRDPLHSIQSLRPPWIQAVAGGDPAGSCCTPDWSRDVDSPVGWWAGESCRLRTGALLGWVVLLRRSKARTVYFPVVVNTGEAAQHGAYQGCGGHRDGRNGAF
jgi:hypothetical protein